MDEEDFRLRIRLVVLEDLISRLLAMQTAGLDDSQFMTLCERWVGDFHQMTFECEQVVQSDFASAELSSALTAILKDVSRHRKGMQSRLG